MAICAYVVVVGVAAGLGDVLQDVLAACMSVSNLNFACAGFTHLLWMVPLSSVPRMPSSRRRVVWLVCAGEVTGCVCCQSMLDTCFHEAVCLLARWGGRSGGGCHLQGMEARSACLLAAVGRC
jgi:hypothetical protein